MFKICKELLVLGFSISVGQAFEKMENFNMAFIKNQMWTAVRCFRHKKRKHSLLFLDVIAFEIPVNLLESIGFTLIRLLYVPFISIAC